ncbi:MAG: low-complexity tail membrane protein [Prochlorococcaceae cyanobacterium]
MTPRSEGLLWIQLLGLAALPLELLLLLVLFAGADPGPVPALERLLVWGLGALLPAVLLWKRPPDLWSLVLVQVPLRGRRPLQQRLSALQAGLGLQLSRAAGAALLLPLTWWADQQSGLATGLSPFGASGRLVVLLLSVPLLALMLWQWQQLVQALRLLTLDQARVNGATPLTLAQLEQSRLSLGLPLLLFDPLHLAPPPTRVIRPDSAQAEQPEPGGASGDSRPEGLALGLVPEELPSRLADVPAETKGRPAAGEGSSENLDAHSDAPTLDSRSESSEDPLASEAKGPSTLEPIDLEAPDPAAASEKADFPLSPDIKSLHASEPAEIEASEDEAAEIQTAQVDRTSTQNADGAEADALSKEADASSSQPEEAATQGADQDTER